MYERDHSDREEERDLPGVLRKVLLMRKMLQQLRALQVMVRVTGEVVDKYDKDIDIDNDNDFSEFSLFSEVPVNLACTTRSGRVVRAYLPLDI